MSLVFDLIGDLHLPKGETIDWSNKPTSLFCLVTGNISSDRQTAIDMLAHLATVYDTVFFIDGMLEHKKYHQNIINSYISLQLELKDFKNIVNLHNNIIILNGIAILATNGWSTFNFDWKENVGTLDFLHNSGEMIAEITDEIHKMALMDHHYLVKSMIAIQKMPDVKKVLVVTNAVPEPRLVNHDSRLQNNFELNQIGSLGITSCLLEDFEHKVSTWCFGRYSGDMDIMLDSIRYVNNPAVGKNLDFYYPKRIEIGF